MELDSSIFYTLDQKEESQKDRGSLDIAAIPTDYAIVKNVPDYECAALVYYIQDINEEWISDKTRFCYDGLKRQRLNDPMIRGADGRFKAVSWRDALAVVAEVIHQVKPEEVAGVAGVAGKLSDAESMMALKDFLNRVGSNNVWCEGNANPNADLRSGYLLNTGISGLEKTYAFLLVGTQYQAVGVYELLKEERNQLLLLKTSINPFLWCS